MDLTSLLPCEILQLVSNNLLPRYQCRFALTSKHHYQYLYSYLLKWHAQKAAISIPTHRMVATGMSLLGYSNKVIQYNSKYFSAHGYRVYRPLLFIRNFSGSSIVIDEPRGKIAIKKEYYTEPGSSYNYYIYYTQFGFNIFDEFYKYMRGSIFTQYASIRISPLLSLPRDVLYNIIRLLPYETIKMLKNIHPYMPSITY